MLGLRLWAVLQEAGLRPLGMIGIQPHFGPGDPDAIAAIAMLVTAMRAVEPLIVGTGVATAEEIGLETFEQRLMDELQRLMADGQRNPGTVPILLGAWATTGPE